MCFKYKVVFKIKYKRLIIMIKNIKTSKNMIKKRKEGLGQKDKQPEESDFKI